MTLEEKIIKAIGVITDCLSRSKNPFIDFTGDKDSLATLHIIRKVCNGPISVLFVDTSVYFNEIYLFVEKMRKLWRFNLIKERNEEALKNIKIAEDKAECCLQLKEKTLKNSIKKYNIDYFFTGIIRDDQEGGSNKEYISTKDDHIRVNPLIYFSEDDVWEYIKAYNLPYCSLYDKGYRNIDCIPCTEPPEGHDKLSERLQDKDLVISKLRQLGYI